MNMASKKSSSSLESDSKSEERKKKLPSLIVFDLDNTLWTPELFQLRKLQRANIQPIAGQDVKLYPAVKSIIDSIRKVKGSENEDTWQNTKFAVASRTKSVEWARNLLNQMGLDYFFSYMEIFPGDKKKHFRNLHERTGIPYEDMLFFDDNRDGKYGNCVPVSEMGVFSVHCPGGINDEKIWDNALDKYDEWRSSSGIDGTPKQVLVEWDGTLTDLASQPNHNEERFEGTVKAVNPEKRYGFIRYNGDRNSRSNDMFFHFNDLPKQFSSEGVNRGDKLSFKVTHDSKKGKSQASEIEVISSTMEQKETVEMRVFSMNLPFAALLANEYKTLETRNGTMFVPYPEGTKFLLHVGQRIYPDGNRHIDVMKSGGLSDGEIEKLKSLPKGFGKGMAVAIVEIGKTFETTLEERSQPDFQRSVGAFGEDSGMRATEIKRVQYLKRGVRVSGRGGVFKANVDKDAIPDGWL